MIGCVLRGMIAVASFDLSPRHWRRVKHLTPAPSAARILRSLLHWLMFLPAMLALLCSALVYIGSHPVIGPSSKDPMAMGIYFDPVSFNSADGSALDAWLVPVVNATRILAEKEAALSQRHAAIVLVPDTGAPREQMLPLVAWLHDAGYILLVINPRGSESCDPAGSTFGVRESTDVQFAVNMMRRRPFVDPKRVGVLGIGTGANAALMAAKNDPSIHTLVLLSPEQSGEDIVAKRIVPRQPWLEWMAPLCKWTFEMAYQVDIDELELHNFEAILSQKETLRMTEGEALRQAGRTKLIEFLTAHLAPPADTPLARLR
jgi:hypothetical protein